MIPLAPELLADLRAAKIPLVQHLPLVLLGTTPAGEPYSLRGIVLGWSKHAAAWRIDGTGPGPARVRFEDGRWMEGGVDARELEKATRRAGKRGKLPGPEEDVWIFHPWHLEPVPDVTTRVGFLLLCDEAERRGITRCLLEAHCERGTVLASGSLDLRDLRTGGNWEAGDLVIPALCRALALTSGASNV